MSRLKTLTKTWTEFDLPNFQVKLDEVATDIANRQDESETNRNSLIEKLSEFIEVTDEETRCKVADIIKSFQSEVDFLSDRSQEAEKAFFDVYKKVTTEISDPVPVLNSCLETQKRLSKMQDMEIEINQLRETLSDYNTEIQGYKAKEKKMAELQAKVEAYDRNIDATLEERIGAVSEEIEAEAEERIRVIQTEKDVLVKRLGEQDRQIKDLRRKLDESQTELFDIKRVADESTEAKVAEVEILLNDLENANHRAVIAEKTIESLKREIEKLSNDKNKVRDEDDSNIMIELNAKTKEIEQLLLEISKVNEEKKELEEKHLESLKKWESERDESSKMVTELSRKLENQSDYESIKKELSIFRSLEFSMMKGSSEEQNKPLEVLILERSKVLQSENSSLRFEKETLSSELEQVKEELGKRNFETESQKKLIKELEEHVESLQELSNRGEAEGRSSTDILSEALNERSSTQDHHNLLPIIQAQKERFRRKAEELEEINSSQLQQITLLQSQVSELQADNVKMYEKIRFLQSASSATKTSNSDIESRYRSHYEQHIDPFNQFNRQERQRRFGQLNIFEKITLSMVQFIMSNKMARTFVFAYSVLLHGLVFLVLMKMAYTDSYIRDQASSEWREKFAQHMHEVHDVDHIG